MTFLPCYFHCRVCSRSGALAFDSTIRSSWTAFKRIYIHFSLVSFDLLTPIIFMRGCLQHSGIARDRGRYWRTDHHLISSRQGLPNVTSPCTSHCEIHDEMEKKKTKGEMGYRPSGTTERMISQPENQPGMLSTYPCRPPLQPPYVVRPPEGSHTGRLQIDAMKCLLQSTKD